MARAGRLATAFAVLLSAAPLRAEQELPSVQPSLSVGLVEVLTLARSPEHLGLYVNPSLDVTIRLNADWSLIPSVGIEFAPETGAWGGTFFLILDRYLTTVGGVILALDPVLGIFHDAFPDGDGGFEHAYYLSGGLGMAVVFERFLLIPQCSVAWGLDGEGWSLAPTLVFSVPI